MTTFHLASDAFTSLTKRSNCALPSSVRLGSLILSLHFCDTGAENDGTSTENTWRVDCGAVGARSGSCVCGLSQVPPADALALRNERSSSRNRSRFLPQRWWW